MKKRKEKDLNIEQEDDFLDGIKSLSSASDREDDVKHLSPKKRRNKAVARARRARRFIVLIIILGLLCGGAYPAYNYLFLPYSAELHYKNMKNSYGKTDPSLPAEYLKKFGKVYTESKEIGGWVLVAGTDINYPVATQEKHDNLYWEQHLLNGWKNPVGTPYFMSSYRKDNTNKNIAIHGNYDLFSGLDKYLDVEFYKTSPILSIDTLTDEGYYKVFAACTMVNSEVSNFSRNNFISDFDFKLFINAIAAKTVIATPVTVKPDDTVVSLFTHNGSKYTAVFARKMRAGENSSVDVDKAYTKTSGSAAVTEIYDEPSSVVTSVPPEKDVQSSAVSSQTASAVSSAASQSASTVSADTAQPQSSDTGNNG